MLKRPDMTLWTGRVDEVDGEAGLRVHQWVRPLEADSVGPGSALLGFCCDEGVRLNQGRPGSAGGPSAIRKALASNACHLVHPLFDAGNVDCPDNKLSAAQTALSEQVGNLLDRGLFPLLLGGGHEVAYGSFAGLRHFLEKTRPGGVLGIINLDAHFDLRNPVAGATSGTPFAQAANDSKLHGLQFNYLCLGINRHANTRALFARAEECGASYMFDTELQDLSDQAPLERLREFVARCDCIYLSIDLDVLPAATAPGVSAPSALGVPLAMVLRLVDELRRATDADGAAKLVLADIAEMNPAFDVDSRTAKVAARLCQHLLV